MHTSRDEIVTPVGLIREADRDRDLFELREITGTLGVMRFTFAEEVAEDVLDAFQDEYRVKVAGVKSPGVNRYNAIVVERVDE